ncbi:MAG: D-alanyl-D-alanine carboxypeptidase family protein [Bacilli bacterium]
MRYPKNKDSITGYMYEPWHIRYVGKELAKKLYNDGQWITLEEYYGIESKYK